MIMKDKITDVSVGDCCIMLKFGSIYSKCLMWLELVWELTVYDIVLMKVSKQFYYLMTCFTHVLYTHLYLYMQMVFSMFMVSLNDLSGAVLYLQNVTCTGKLHCHIG